MILSKKFVYELIQDNFFLVQTLQCIQILQLNDNAH